MILDFDEAIRLLGVPEPTLRRWIRQGKIPCREGKGRYYFIRKEIEKWARTHHMFLHHDREDAVSRDPGKELDLLGAMRRGGVFFHVEGNTPEDVLRRAVSLAPLPSETDKTLLLEMLLQREALASTGIGEGVAIPHPRYPVEHLPGDALITTCFLDTPVDFRSIDGRPVFVLFLMLSPTTDIHLKLLSRLSFCLRDAAFMAFLRKCDAAEALFDKVKEIQESFDG